MLVGEAKVMLYFLVIGAVGLSCALGLRWPVMAGAALLVAITCCFVELKRGASVLEAAWLSVASFLVLQLSYVIGGFLLTLRLRQILAKKNANAWKEIQ